MAEALQNGLLKVPGQSPAHYHGDPTNDILQIESLDLIPNPPVEDDTIYIRLRGRLTKDLDKDTRLISTFTFKNEKESFTVPDDVPLPAWIEVYQNSTGVWPPQKGAVEMVYSRFLFPGLVEKGNYTLHIEVYTSAQERVTNFEGTVLINGTRDGNGDWW